MRDILRLKGELREIQLSPTEDLLNNLKREGLVLRTIPRNGDFSDYIDYVLENKNELRPEFKYIENNLKKGESWGEILIVKNKNNKIVASLGPNRIEKDKQSRIRARPGYFSALPKFRNKKIGTVLWKIGIKKMREMGASYIEVSVEKKNLFATKLYLNFGMEIKL